MIVRIQQASGMSTFFDVFKIEWQGKKIKKEISNFANDIKMESINSAGEK